MSKKGLGIILSLLLLIGSGLGGCGKEGGDKENKNQPAQPEQTSGQETSQSGGQADSENGNGAADRLMEDAGTTITRRFCKAEPAKAGAGAGVGKVIGIRKGEGR